MQLLRHGIEPARRAACSGRHFRHQARVLLGDAAPDGRARFDALARWLQDAAYPDVVDAGLAGDGGWVVRRCRIEVVAAPQFGEALELETWCSGLGELWAERRTTVRGAEGGRVEASRCGCTSTPTGRPRPLSDPQLDVWGASAEGRRVRARLQHAGPPPDAAVMPWRFRVADLDVAGHVNNAAYWTVLGDHATPAAAEVEYRSAALAGDAVVRRDGDRLVGATDGTVHASFVMAACLMTVATPEDGVDTAPDRHPGSSVIRPVLPSDPCGARLGPRRPRSGRPSLETGSYSGTMTTTAEATAQTTLNPLDLLDTDWLLSDEEKLIRDNVRALRAQRGPPGRRRLVRQGRAAGARAGQRVRRASACSACTSRATAAPARAPMAYGLAVMELEAGDSGIRSLVSVQGSLAMYAIWRFGSEEQKQQWLPRMAAGEAIGCFGLTEPDFGSNPGGMRTRAKRDGDDWVLNGQKMWITNGSIADVAVVWARTDEGVRGFVVPTDTPGFSAPEIHKKMSLRASVTSELVLDDVRAAGRRDPARGDAASKSALALPQRGAHRHRLRRDGRRPRLPESAVEYSKTRIQFDKPIGAFQMTQKKLADMAVEVNRGTVLAYHLARLKEAGRLRPEQVSHGQARQRQRRAVGRARGAPDPRRQRDHARVPGDPAHEQPRVRRHLRGHRRGPRARHRARADRGSRPTASRSRVSSPAGRMSSIRATVTPA